MKKLKLQLDSLAVQSFATDADLPEGTGTVAAHDATEAGSCRGATCNQSCDPGLNTNCVCEPDTISPTWADASCVTGLCQCYTVAPCG